MQAFMFGLTFTNYAVLHVTRSVWSAATKDMELLYGFSVEQVAYMNMCFLLSYSVGGILISQLVDKYEKKLLIAVLYTLISLTNCLIGFMSYAKN